MVSPLCLPRMETQDVLHLLLSRWTKTLKSERRLSISSRAGGSERGRIWGCLKVRDSGLSICYCLFSHGPKGQNVGICCSPFLAGLRLRTECLLGRYLYLFPMRRRFQSGAYPLPCCNWFHSEWGDTVRPTLLSSCGTSLHSPNTHLETCH